jgi:hypothetical protein
LQSQNHFFEGSDNFVCKLCLKQFGFKFVLSYSRLEKEGDQVYYFVSINTRSPIHCGWFDEESLREAPRESEQGTLSLSEVEVFEVPVIDKVLRMKIPQKYKGWDFDEIINQLLMGTIDESQPYYGSEHNFYFLVVWEGSDYTAATWEDQTIIFKDQGTTACPQLVKYLLYRKLELTLRDKKPLQPIYELFNKYFPTPQLKEKEPPFN